MDLYYASAQMIAMREISGTTGASTLYYLHTDHLGSTSLVTCGNDAGCGATPKGGVVSRQSYYAYGTPRNQQGTLPTDKTFTGQRAESSSLGSLMDYNARFYSPLSGRFLSADTLVPGAGNPQALNRYMFVLGNPVKYTDPSGHFTDTAIWLYLQGRYGDTEGLRIYQQWLADTEWWDMISTAQAGDVLFGGDQSGGFLYQFTGSGKDRLDGAERIGGKSRYGGELANIQAGMMYDPYDSAYERVDTQWGGIVQYSGRNNPSCPYLRPDISEPKTQNVADELKSNVEFAEGVIAGGVWVGTFWIPEGGPFFATFLAVSTYKVEKAISDAVLDALNLEPNDLHYDVGPAHFNFQQIPQYPTWLEDYSWDFRQ